MAILWIAGAAICADEPLVLVRSIEMPHVRGRIDHLTLDTTEHRLFVAALGNNTVEVIDLGVGIDARSLTGFHEPQGIGQPVAGPVVGVANGGSGDFVLLDRASFRVLRTIALGDDADNVRFEAGSHRFYVGYGSGAIAVVSESGTRLGEVKLSAHPESFQLEANGPRMFVNVPGARHVAVVDRSAAKVIATWSVSVASANYPMALDESSHRLFVGCRRPSVVLVFDTTTGKLVSSTPAVGDTDDMFYDWKRQRLYVIGGEGFVDVFARPSADRLDRIGRLATAPGARTGLFVASDDRLYVAVPRRGGQNAQIRVYESR